MPLFSSSGSSTFATTGLSDFRDDSINTSQLTKRVKSYRDLALILRGRKIRHGPAHVSRFRAIP